jgi:hypothetical protein
MAHWLLRERMAEHNEDGRPGQEHPRRDQHLPEQHKGHDEADKRAASERASEPRERSAPAQRRARERVRESEGRKPLG